MDAACSREKMLENPAALLASMLVEMGTAKGKPNHVMMPYANNLYLLADWFRQLWAESLGKEKDTQGREVFAGFTPIKALGATDQHSQIQLYREGPNDKVIGLVAVEKFSREVEIPTGLGVDALQYLEGKKMGDLLNAERRATEYALVESLRPNFTITFPQVDEYHVGQFINLWQIATAYAGLLLGVDAYNQPAVETGKQATFGLMGRKGYEEHEKVVRETLQATKWAWRG
jgi:glucose-6-phosphate isomerase